MSELPLNIDFTGQPLQEPPEASEAFPLPTVEDAFPPPDRNEYADYDPQFGIFQGETFDKMFGEGRAGYILNKFAQGVYHNWGTERGYGDTSPPTAEEAAKGEKTLQGYLKAGGFYNEWEKGEKNWIKGINELFMRGGAALADIGLIRAPMSLVGGVSAAVEATGLPFSREIAALPEAFPGGHMTGFPTRVPVPQEYVAAGRLPGEYGVPLVPRIEMLERAQELDVIPGRMPEGLAREAMAPPQEAQLSEGEALALKRKELGDLRRGLEVETYRVGGMEVPASARLLDTERAVAEGRPVDEGLRVNEGLRGQLDRDIAAIDARVEQLRLEEQERLEAAMPKDPPPDTSDVHAIARSVEPDTFREFDSLTEQKAELSTLLDDLARERDASAQKRVDDLLARVNGVESRLTQAQTLRLELARRELEEIRSVDSPTMAEVRRQREEVGYRMRDLSPTVSEAYRRAEGAVRPREEPVAAPPTTTLMRGAGEVTRLGPRGEIVSGPGYRLPEPTPVAPPVVRAPETVTRRAFTKDFVKEGVVDLPAATAALAARVEAAKAQGRTAVLHQGRERTTLASGEGGVVRDSNGNAVDLTPLATEAGRSTRVEISGSPKAAPRAAAGALEWELPSAASLDRGRELSQRGRSIARDAQTRLVLAGRSLENARAEGALVAAYYETWAARFKGALGNSWQFYQREAPWIRRGGTRGEPLAPGELGQPNRGKISLPGRGTRATITLFKDADASTFMHEFGHLWLEDLTRFSQHPLAPADLRADATTVRDWLKVPEGPISRRAHEQWARGVERYLVEGQAPTSRLAAVFQRFKDWLTSVYETVNALRVPINDNIRDVYARLLSENREPVITPERTGAVDFSRAAEDAARTVPAGEALDAASRVLAEREAVAGSLSKEVESGRRDARRGPEGSGVPEREGAGRGDVGVGEEPGAENAPISTGRSVPPGKSSPPSDANATFTDPVGGYLDRDGNVMVENLNAAEDVKAAIYEVVDKMGDTSGITRSVLSDAEVYRLADDIGMSTRYIDRKVGETYNAEHIIALRKLVREQGAVVRDKQLATVEGDMKAILDYKVERERLLMMVEQMMGARAETGRSLRAWRRLRDDLDPDMMRDFFQGKLGKTPAELQLEAKLGLAMNTPQKRVKFLLGQEKTTFGWQLHEAYVNALVSGTFTHAVNLVTNSMVVGTSIVETAGAAVVSKVLRTNAVEFREVGMRLSAIAQGMHEGAVAFGRNLQDENVAFTEAERALDIGKRQAIPSTVQVAGYEVPLGKAVRFPARLLAAEDAFFKAIAERQELVVQAHRNALAEGLEGIAYETRVADLLRSPTDLMTQAARNYAEVQTFTDQPGWIGQALTKASSSHPLAAYFLPFVRTPTNILRYGAERTPFGLASKHVWNNLLGKNGDVARATQIARLAIGTTMMGAAGYWAFNGNITGGGPHDPGKREVWLAQGNRPYSIRFPGTNTWWGYTQLQPIAWPLGVGADMAELAQSGVRGEEWDKLGAMALLTVSRNFFDRSAMKGLSDLFETLSDPDRYLAGFLKRLAGTVITPPGTAQLAHALDPVQRDTRDFLNYLKSRIPFASQSVPPAVDLLGQEKRTYSAGVGTISSTIDNPVLQMMERLNLGKTKPERDIDKIPLTAEQYHDLSVIGGQEADKRLAQLAPMLARMPDNRKKELISSTIDNAHKFARTKVKMNSLGTENDIVKQALAKKLALIHGSTAP
jgi:hypothetical protein